MTKLRLLSAAVVLSTALASPALAQQVVYNPGYCAQFYPNANCQNLGPGSPYTGSYQRVAYRDSYNRWDDDRRGYRQSGFGPAGVAAGVAGAAIGTAGAIATAPFRAADSYAYYNNGDRYQRVAYRNSYNRWDDGRRDYRQTGFGPAGVAAGVAGAAIGTAGAIATAPFRAADSYAYYNSGDRGWSQSYAERNGFVCQPGTWFRGEDGRQHICQ
jgi:hypothetical protein